jgi:hypothetical protein
MVVDKKFRTIVCTVLRNGEKYDFKLFKESKVPWSKKRRAITDFGYTGDSKNSRNNSIAKKAKEGRIPNERRKARK